MPLSLFTTLLLGTDIELDFDIKVIPINRRYVISARVHYPLSLILSDTKRAIY